MLERHPSLYAASDCTGFVIREVRAMRFLQKTEDLLHVCSRFYEFSTYCRTYSTSPCRCVAPTTDITLPNESHRKADRPPRAMNGIRASIHY
jgi:hypothetical protein